MYIFIIYAYCSFSALIGLDIGVQYRSEFRQRIQKNKDFLYNPY